MDNLDQAIEAARRILKTDTDDWLENEQYTSHGDSHDNWIVKRELFDAAQAVALALLSVVERPEQAELTTLREKLAEAERERDSFKIAYAETGKAREAQQSRADAAEVKCAELEGKLKSTEGHLTSYKLLYDVAINAVDRVFQVDSTKPQPLLPNFLKPGDCKFNGVVRLAEAYKGLEAKCRSLEAERVSIHRLNDTIATVNQEQRATIAALEATLKTCCENEEAAREIAAKVLGEKAHGDSHCVPSVADLMEMVVAKLAAIEPFLDNRQLCGVVKEVTIWNTPSGAVRSPLGDCLIEVADAVKE